ncbi:MAG: hypothetical protein CMH30_07405 [Micavibrio sp.]|nr:hypothetical protein [Micavibrio sp.]
MFVILFLLVLSAFFSGSETALTAASKASMHGLEKEGNKRASLVNRLRERKDKMIGALLLGNNLVNILASALATVLFLKLVGESGVVWATLVMTLLVLIFSEVMPKTYALLYSSRMALVVAPVVKYIVLIFGPITEAVVWLVYKILSVFGIDTSNIADTSEEELRGAIELHEGQDVERWEQRAMLRSILDLAEVEVSEIMTHRKNMVMIDVETPLDQIITEVLNCPYTRLPIWKDNQDNIIGIIHAKWLMRELQKMGDNYKELNLGEVASEAWFIPETTTLFDQLQAFKERKEHFAIVIDEYGALMGVVTLEDILEEIVGEIDDEHDVPVPGVTPMPNGAYVVEGTVAIRDLNREFEWNLSDEEDYSTVAGLILYESKMIPEVGQVFNFQGFRFKVTKRQRNQIMEVKIYPPEKQK